MNVLEERYPQLEFLMHIAKKEKRALPAAILEAPSIDELVGYSLEEIETVIVYGIGQGGYFTLLKDWLEGSLVREIVFVEDDIQVLVSLQEKGLFSPIFSHHRVKLAYKMEGAKLEELAAEVIAMSPTNKIEVFCLKGYQKTKKETFEELSLHLFKMSFMIDAARKETLYYHKLMANLIPNFYRLPGAFFANQMKGAFTDIPAFICGAGPSLENSVKSLKEVEHKGLIFAGGSTISALSNFGVLPHFAVAIDPNKEEWDCLKRNSAFEVPFIFGSRVLQGVFNLMQGDIGYVQTFSGGPVERMVEEKLGLTGYPFDTHETTFGFSVTTLCINLALHFGCNPIVLCGVDLAYTNDEHYAKGVMDKKKSIKSRRSDDRVLVRKNSKTQREVKTLVKWVMEAEWIAEKAKKAPAQFINATHAGIGFEGIKTESLEKVVSSLKKPPTDLRGWIRAEIEEAKIKADPLQITEVLSSLKKSVDCVKNLLDQLIFSLEKEKRLDHPLVILYTSDLKEELAYQKLFNGIETEIKIAIERQLPRLDKQEIQREIKKYQLMRQMSLDYQALLSR